MGYLGNKLKGKYHKDTFQTAVNMAWPAIVESFFIAFAGLVDSLMVSSLGSYAVAAVGLTTQPKLLGLAFFFALNVSISALVARRRGEQRQGAANETLVCSFFAFLKISARVSPKSTTLIFFHFVPRWASRLGRYAAAVHAAHRLQDGKRRGQSLCHLQRQSAVLREYGIR